MGYINIAGLSISEFGGMDIECNPQGVLVPNIYTEVITDVDGEMWGELTSKVEIVRVKFYSMFPTGNRQLILAKY